MRTSGRPALAASPKTPGRTLRLVYLVDPDTAEAYTYSTSSWGGRAAVIELGDQIARMRTTYPDAAPIVELRAVEMPNRFGRKSKPALKVVGWKNANARPTETAKPVERIRPIITSGRQALASPEPPPSAPPVEVYDGPEIDDFSNTILRSGGLRRLTRPAGSKRAD